MTPETQVRVAFQDAPGTRVGLGLVGDGSVSAGHDGLVLEGDVARGRPLVWAAFGLWLVALGMTAVFALRGGDLDHPPVWLVAGCIAIGACGLVARVIAPRMRAFHTFRMSWNEVRAALPMGLSMRLVTNHGESVLVGLGPSGAAELQRLGELIVARASGAPYTEPRASSNAKWFALGFALLLGGLISLAVWDSRYRALYVDNAGRDPIDLWLDGVRLQTIAPNVDGKHPTKLRVRAGKHRLGHSEPGAARPTTELDADIAAAALFNPGSAGCYWRRVALYEPANGVGDPHHDRAPTGADGPLSIQPFYNLSKIDDWFTDPPTSVEFRRNETSISRTALVRNEACTNLAKRGCPMAVRLQLVSCQTIAKTQDDMNACEQRSIDACTHAAVE